MLSSSLFEFLVVARIPYSFLFQRSVSLQGANTAVSKGKGKKKLLLSVNIKN